MGVEAIVAAVVAFFVGAIPGVAWAAWKIGAVGSTLDAIEGQLVQVRAEVHQLFELHTEQQKQCSAHGADQARRSAMLADGLRRVEKLEAKVNGLSAKE